MNTRTDQEPFSPANSIPSSLSRRRFLKAAALTSAALATTWIGRATARAAASAGGAGPLQVAVITGGHLFDVPNFHRLFRALDGIEAYIQPMADFTASPEKVRDSYDVLLFYIMLMEDPAEAKRPGPADQAKAVLERLGATEQGIVIIHHALLAYPKSALWSEVVGIADRKFTFDHDQTLQVQVADSNHPITRRLRPWEMIDEIYGMDNASEGSKILLTVDHPKSMKTIAWTRQYKKARVFCTESGHDNQTWVNPNFKLVLRRGILWSAHRLE
jgi:hypothetical protein